MKHNTLRDMKAALEHDSEVRIIGISENTKEIFDGHEYGRSNHEVTFYVTLKQDTYDPKILTRWLLKYDPKRNRNFDAFELSGEFLKLAVLFFKEIIGKVVVNKELKFTDSDLIKSLGLEDRTKSLQSVDELKRGVLVRLFPNAHFARLAMQNLPCSSRGYLIPVKELKKTNGKFF